MVENAEGATFDMPATGRWEQRGGWVVRRLAADAALTPEQAAGLVGNLGYESAGFTALQEIKPLVPGSAGGYGWAQWTGPRRREFERWCAERGLAPASDEANYGFLLFELLGSFKGFSARLRQMQSVEDACRLTHEMYERPQDVLDGSYRSGPDRLTWARRALAGAGGAVATRTVAPALAGTPRDRIRAIQAALRDAGHYRGEIDGLFGPLSRAALNALLASDGQRPV